LGERVLRVWMSVIKDEHDYLGEVLRRYQATGTIDAVLAEVEGGWATALGSGWSAVSATSAGRRQVLPLVTVSAGNDVDSVASVPSAAGEDAPGQKAAPRRYRLVPERSVVLIEVRSTVGPLSFGALGVTGFVEAVITDGVVRVGTQPSGRIAIDVTGLRSGNGLYDAELLRRIDARRFPTATVELCNCDQSGVSSRYNLEGALTFHGVTRTVQGTVSVEAISDRLLLISGEQAFDIRDFALPSPTVLMLRIYPDVRVQLQAEAELEDTR
jgi:YceI-like domain